MRHNRIFYPTMPWFFFDLQKYAGKRKCKIYNGQGFLCRLCRTVSWLFSWFLLTQILLNWIPNATKNQNKLCHHFSFKTYREFEQIRTQLQNGFYNFRAFFVFFWSFLLVWWIKINISRVKWIYSIPFLSIQSIRNHFRAKNYKNNCQSFSLRKTPCSTIQSILKTTSG